MNYTYKLDEKGIPYRAEALSQKKNKPLEGKTYQMLSLLPHEGSLKKFNLYNIAF